MLPRPGIQKISYSSNYFLRLSTVISLCFCSFRHYVLRSCCKGYKFLFLNMQYHISSLMFFCLFVCFLIKFRSMTRSILKLETLSSHWYVEALHQSCNSITFLLGFEYNICKQINQEREGEQIDRTLLKNVLDVFVEIGMGSMDCYINDFEEALLNDTTAYYSRKASIWIQEDSCPDYMIKVLRGS